MENQAPRLESKHLQILHLSDLHFGGSHFLNENLDEGGVTLASTLEARLAEIPKDIPLLICLTGDFADKALQGEFAKAKTFIDQVRAALSQMRHRFFIVPGNHDVKFTEDSRASRYSEYLNFHNCVFNTRFAPTHLEEVPIVHDIFDDFGAIVACFDSSQYVKKDTEEADRGRIDQNQIKRFEDDFVKIPVDRRKNAIKIAMIHHHPILIPYLHEEDKQYDAVKNSSMMMQILKKHRFHVILHGHKHKPFTFTDDIVAGFQSDSDPSLMVVAGGSAGSLYTGGEGSTQTHNYIRINFDPVRDRSRIRVETYGLENKFDRKGRETYKSAWKWETIRVDDRDFESKDRDPLVQVASSSKCDRNDYQDIEEIRVKEYKSSRGNLLAVKVQPSLEPEQAYIATVWLVKHDSVSSADKAETPKRVVYTAGSKFPVIEVKDDVHLCFAVKFEYYCPMLIQARIEFEDGHVHHANIYALMP